MKKKIAILALVCALVASIVFSLTACGGKDWSKATYDDYDPAVFMTKEGIKYGFVEDETSRENVINDFGTPTAYLACYEDGSVAAIGCLVYGGLYKPDNEFGCGVDVFVEAKAIAYSWGYWTQEGNNLTIHVQGIWLPDYYDKENGGAPVEGLSVGDVLAGEWTYEVELKNGSATISDYNTIAMSSIAILPIHYKGTPAYKSLMAFAKDVDRVLTGAN